MRWSELGARGLLALRLLLLNGERATVNRLRMVRRIARQLRSAFRLPRCARLLHPWPVRASPPIPKGLRPRLEAARLDTLALLRAIDRALIA